MQAIWVPVTINLRMDRPRMIFLRCPSNRGNNRVALCHVNDQRGRNDDPATQGAHHDAAINAALGYCLSCPAKWCLGRLVSHQTDPQHQSHIAHITNYIKRQQ